MEMEHNGLNLKIKKVYKNIKRLDYYTEPKTLEIFWVNTYKF